MEADKEHSDNFPVSVGRGPGPDDDQYSVSSGSDTGNVSPGSVMNCEWLAGDNSRQQQRQHTSGFLSSSDLATRG